MKNVVVVKSNVEVVSNVTKGIVVDYSLLENGSYRIADISVNGDVVSVEYSLLELVEESYDFSITSTREGVRSMVNKLVEIQSELGLPVYFSDMGYLNALLADELSKVKSDIPLEFYYVHNFEDDEEFDFALSMVE